LRTDWAAVGAITVLAAAVRLLGLDAKGFWEDEAVSIYLVHMDLGGMLSTIPDTERTPPLYYLLAWGWTRLFGYGEVGIRSLSVLIGTATVPLGSSSRDGPGSWSRLWSRSIPCSSGTRKRAGPTHCWC
jgi:uncharacterized membrane protein